MNVFLLFAFHLKIWFFFFNVSFFHPFLVNRTRKRKFFLVCCCLVIIHSLYPCRISRAFIFPFWVSPCDAARHGAIFDAIRARVEPMSDAHVQQPRLLVSKHDERRHEKACGNGSSRHRFIPPGTWIRLLLNPHTSGTLISLNSCLLQEWFLSSGTRVFHMNEGFATSISDVQNHIYCVFLMCPPPLWWRETWGKWGKRECNLLGISTNYTYDLHIYSYLVDRRQIRRRRTQQDGSQSRQTDV